MSRRANPARSRHEPPAVVPVRRRAVARDRARRSPPLRVACLGDSITEGYGTGDPVHKSYPAQLAGLLGAGYEVRNFGVGGATLLDSGDKPYRSLPAFAQACAFQPEIIVIGLGTNDSKPQNWQFRDRFVANYVSLLRQLRSLPSKPRLFICQPMPAWPPSGWGISPEVIEHELRPMIADLARAESTGLIDLFTPMRDQHANTPDHVHPNAEGAAILARTVAQAIRPPNP
ncbi:GDSL-type esterase/lipase family protein [Oleiharenicola sp. Vm1]|uniref:GDSL-type esterase/lipase family protein n=1 Tax=Oleiharenicola sp. Vm1 TaxID=3398393 RepID=UPI0039F5F659